MSRNARKILEFFSFQKRLGSLCDFIKKLTKKNIKRFTKNFIENVKNSFYLVKIFFTRDMFFISVMNFIGVIPYYLTGSTLMLWFMDIGFSYTSIGLVAILNLPHAAKFLWSHLFDSIKVPFLSNILGVRRSWMFVCEFCIVAILSMLSFINPSNDIFLFCTLVFICNFFVSSHNILCLAVQMEVIPKKLWGASEAMNVLGFRSGMIFASAGSLYLSQFIDWHLIYRFMAILIIPGMFFVFFAKFKFVNVNLSLKYSGNFVSHFVKSIRYPLVDFFRVPNVYVVVLFMIFYSLYDHLLANMHKIFHLSLGFSKAQVALVDNTFGMFMTLLGGFLSGLMISRYGATSVMRLGSVMEIFVGLGLVMQNYVGLDIVCLYTTVAMQEIVHGFTMTSFFTYQMNCCSVQFAVSQLSFLKALDSIGKYAFGSISGFLVDLLGWNGFFVLITVASLPAIIIMNFKKFRNVICNASDVRNDVIDDLKG